MNWQEHEVIEKQHLKNCQVHHQLLNIANVSNKLSDLKNKYVKELLKFVVLTDEEQEYYN